MPLALPRPARAGGFFVVRLNIHVGRGRDHQAPRCPWPDLNRTEAPAGKGSRNTDPCPLRPRPTPEAAQSGVKAPKAELPRPDLDPGEILSFPPLLGDRLARFPEHEPGGCLVLAWLVAAGINSPQPSRPRGAEKQVSLSSCVQGQHEWAALPRQWRVQWE